MPVTRKRRTPKYRSGLEQRVGDCLLAAGIEAKHEVETLKYVQPEVTRKYLVDFQITQRPELIVEAKGRFTSDDRKKMLFIRDQYPDRTIVMIFGRASNTISKASKTKYCDWCDANGIAWVDIRDFERSPKCLLKLPGRPKDGVLQQLSKNTHKKTTRTLANL